MKKIDIDYINNELIKDGSKPLKLVKSSYKEVKVNDENTSLVDDNKNNIGTKGDMYTKQILDKILQVGCLDKNPRPHYEDGEKAHTLSYNHGMTTYDLTKGEFPITTLRPIAVKSSIGEILWIYQDQSNDLDLLKEKYGITWWDEWDIGNRTIGATYGEVVRRHNLMKNLLLEMEKDPDGRRHILSLWQNKDYEEKHGLKPCAFLTEYHIRHGRDGIDYLDASLTQRSSDFVTAGCINQIQYMALQHMVAKHLKLTPGNFTWFYNNIQIYDRHINQAVELLEREPINCTPKIEINEDIDNFYDFTLDDIKVTGYPREEIKEKNPQLKLELGI